MNIIWIIVFLLTLLSGCGYVSWHVWQLLPLTVAGKWIVTGAMLLSIVCLFTNFIFGLDDKPMRVAVTLYELGNSSVFIGLYLLMLFLVLDLGRMVHLIPRRGCHDRTVCLRISELPAQSACAVGIGVFRTSVPPAPAGDAERPASGLS